MRKKIQVIQGDARHFKSDKGNIKVVNQFFGPAFEEDELEYWKKKLDGINISYCVVFDEKRGFSIYCDSEALYESKYFN